MAKIMTVQEALEGIKGKTNKKGQIVPNRFSKKNFETLCLAMLNDPDYVVTVAKKDGDGVKKEEIKVTENFRSFLKKILINAGIDKNDANCIMDKSFKIDDVSGFYEFVNAVEYEFMNAGNKYEFMTKEDFSGSVYIKNVPESTKVFDARNPKDGSKLGKTEKKTKKHKVLSVKSSAPDWLSTKKKLD